MGNMSGVLIHHMCSIPAYKIETLRPVSPRTLFLLLLLESDEPWNRGLNPENMF